jgi:hypothetical protein
LKKNNIIQVWLNRGKDFWSVTGSIPLSICNDLYLNHGDIGAKEIRYNGYEPSVLPPINYANVDPELIHQYGYYRTVDNKKWNGADGPAKLDPQTIPTATDLEKLLKDRRVRLDQIYVGLIQIDTQRALELFVEVLQANNFID